MKGCRALSRRLRDHRRTIRKADTILKIDDCECRALVVQSGWQVAAEDYLINLFQPAWNNDTEIFGLGKHGDDPKTRANLRSPWDTLQPGRDWRHHDPNMKDARPPENFLADLQQYFTRPGLYATVDDILKSFFEELRS